MARPANGRTTINRGQAVVSGLIVVSVMAAAALALLSRAADAQGPPTGTGGRQHGTADGEHGGHDQGQGEMRHVHAPVPAEYRSAHVPASAWTDLGLLARGKVIYASRCAVCHGDSGDGRGPAAVPLPVKPADLRDPRMVAEMRGNYWFWRVSEGGLTEPFKSMGSAMPAWKNELSVEDRWAVIAYEHTFSGHEGPHVTSEHPTLGEVSDEGQGAAATHGGHK